jgi:staphylococcal nuclease domain-containing protein 1
MTDISDASLFYLRFQSNSDFAKIESEMSKFNSSISEDLEKPIKKGTICAARFEVDDKWYRAKVIQSIGKGDFEVQFIDYGNYDTINGSSGDLKRLPEKLMLYEP